MGKSLFIAEKPSVAQEFAKVLQVSGPRRDGYLENDQAVVTWCVGHLITMSYPEVYDPALKRWSLNTLPFIPEEFKYEVIPAVGKQFNIVKQLLNRKDVDTIYVCTDSGREGEYIYRLVEQMAGPEVKKKIRKRVWIDSQTEEAIREGIREAKDLSEYDHLAASAYLRAKEDYLMGINFSRLLTLKYGNTISGLLKQDRTVLSVGRVMTCVLGMVVRREREIRNFVKTPFYRVIAVTELEGMPMEAEWKAVPGSAYMDHPCLYKENGFKERGDAERLIHRVKCGSQVFQEVKGDEKAVLAAPEVDAPWDMILAGKEKKKEKKNPPLLFNLAELQNVCSKTMKLSPDETLKIVQELYEKKLVTYPRTDARVLSTAVAKEIDKNIRGLKQIPGVAAFADDILNNGKYKGIAKTRYTNDKQITDHYAIIPTGQGIGGLSKLSERHVKVYEKIVRRFLSIFYPAAEYDKYTLELIRNEEHFFAGFKVLTEKGFMVVTGEWKTNSEKEGEEGTKDPSKNPQFMEALGRLRKGAHIPCGEFQIREGETSPPKRYTSGSMILAMENAGQLIEDEELRAQIKGSGIGTSATRAEILKKLVTIKYLALNSKTQIITPTLMGEMIYDAVYASIRSLLNPELTASWEKGLSLVADGSITEEEYMGKLQDYISRRTYIVMERNNQQEVVAAYGQVSQFYKKKK